MPEDVRNGVCLLCGSGVLESTGEHIRNDLEPCSLQPADPNHIRRERELDAIRAMAEAMYRQQYPEPYRPPFEQSGVYFSFMDQARAAYEALFDV